MARTDDFLREVKATSSIFTQKMGELRRAHAEDIEEMSERYGLIFDPNVVDWVSEKVEDVSQHILWNVALTLWFERDVPQREISRCTGILQPYISRRAREFLAWMEVKDE